MRTTKRRPKSSISDPSIGPQPPEFDVKSVYLLIFPRAPDWQFQMKKALFAVLLLGAAVSTAGVSNAQVFNVNNYADHAPGTEFLERGNRFYRQGDYDAAIGNFQLAAYWADKLAQFNLGLMYVNGQGVDRDPLRGWAWIKLSAERGYPTNVAVADDIWAQLTDEHREVARTILEEELEPEYGDEVAVSRTANDMKRRLKRTTGGGSRVGANRAAYVVSRDGTFVSGDQYYRDEFWDFEKIVQFETRLHKAIGRGNVILRDLETVDDDEEAQSSQQKQGKSDPDRPD
ncbi:MAG: hypothetical protein WD397_02025 [Wenzhouxiangellaceae bacterium]